MPNAWSLSAHLMGKTDHLSYLIIWLLVIYYDPFRSSIMLALRLKSFFWWRVMKGEIAPITLWNPDKHRGAKKRWRVKGILHIWFQKIENGADKRGTAFYLIIILQNCIVYVACCIAIKSFLNFSSSFHYFEHYNLFFISRTIEIIFFICAVSY